MKIAILSRNTKHHSTRRLASDRPSVHYRGDDLSDVDAVIPRIGASITCYETAVVRQFKAATGKTRICGRG